MKKILIALAVLVVLVGVGVTLLLGNLDELIAETIEKEGSAALGTPVAVESVVTDLKAGKAAINGLTIANPAGYTKPFAISLGSFSADVDYGNQVIEDISIAKPIIFAELNGSKNNFMDLLENMPEMSSDETSEQETSESGSDFEITINRLALTQATVSLTANNFKPPVDIDLGQSFDLGERSFVMDDFILTGLSGTADQISTEVTNKLVSHVSAQVSAYVKEQVELAVKAKVAAELQAKAAEKLDEAKEQVNEKIKDKVGDKLKGFKLKLNRD